MDLPQNAFKRALKAASAQIGLWSSLSSNYSVEVIAGAGFDWILLDSEHSPADLENLLTQLQAAAAYPTHPVVRVAWNDMVTIKRVLDIGAQSLLVPYVSSAAEACSAVSYTRYPPAGVRGVALLTRGARLGSVNHAGVAALNEDIVGIIQIESPGALEVADAIAAIDGVDCLFVGPADLSHSLGVPGQFGDARYQAALRRVVDACRAHGKAAGILLYDPASFRPHLDLGFTFLGIGADISFVNDGVRAALAAARA